MNGCERFQEDLSALLDGMLPEDREREVLAHLAGCPDCAALYDAFDRLSEAMEQEEPRRTCTIGSWSGSWPSRRGGEGGSRGCARRSPPRPAWR